MSPKDFVASVRAAILRYNMLPSGCRAGIAVSGGRDSVVLLDAICKLSHEFDWTLTVLHLNHCLRAAESDGDEDFVKQLAARYGLPALTSREQVALRGGNLEQEARQARHRFFAHAAAKFGLSRVATGHTQSDQAETVLFRFLRGAATTGLAGILPVTEECIVRPLLWCSRDDVAAYAGSCGLNWREDATNTDRRFARNNLRHHLMPHLRGEWNPNVEAVLANTADVAREEERYWHGEVNKVYGALVLSHTPRSVVLDASGLSLYAVALRRRLLRKALTETRKESVESGFEAVTAIEKLLERRAGALTLPGVHARLSFGQLRLGPEASFTPQPVEISGIGVYSFGKSTVQLKREGYNEVELKGEALDSDRITGSLRLRGWVPGDAYQPLGFRSVHKLHELFQKGRVPYWERAGWPIMVMDNQIVWASRFGVAAHVAAGPGTRDILTIQEVSTDA